MARFITIFIVILVALFTIEMLVPVQEHVIVPFTSLLARISATLILPFDSSVVRIAVARLSGSIRPRYTWRPALMPGDSMTVDSSAR